MPNPLSPTVRWVLSLVAAAIGALLAPDVFGILPEWLQIVLGVVSVVVAAAMIPPTWQLNSDKTRAFRGVDRKADHVDVPPRTTSMEPQRRKRDTARWMVAMLLAVLGLVAFTPATASAHWIAEQDCLVALNGGNGDNDLTGYAAATGWQYNGIFSVNHPQGVPHDHWYQHRVIAITKYWAWYGWQYPNAYCVADSSAAMGIADKIPTAPAGW